MSRKDLEAVGVAMAGFTLIWLFWIWATGKILSTEPVEPAPVVEPDPTSWLKGEPREAPDPEYKVR